MFKKGDIVSGKYEIGDPCNNSGGMGAIVFVSLFGSASPERLVLKYCKEPDDECIKRFRREVRLLTEFSGNSKVVQVIDHDLEHDPPFFVMRFYPDGDLTRLGSLPHDLELQEDVFCQMIDCVQELHARQTYHRDIKPQNFLVDNRVIVVSDLGLSMELESRTVFTRTSQFWGTHGYLPPEFERGGFKRADAAGDIFMIGKSIYALLTGRDAMYLVPDDIPPSLFHVIQKCCEIDKGRRYHSLPELKQALVAVYDVLRGRVDGFGRTRQILGMINERLRDEHQYRTDEVKNFLDGLASLDADDQQRLCLEIGAGMFHALKQPPLSTELTNFLQIYRRMVEASNYGWSYAENIASNMSVLFNAENVSIADKASALELAVFAAINQHRFAAMNTCSAMIMSISDDTLGLAVRHIITENAGSFISAIEPSECKCDTVRKAIREMGGGSQ